MEIYMQKIGMIRDDVNPKNLTLNLGIDWAVEYRQTDQDIIPFDIVLKTCDDFRLNFKIEGFVKLDILEMFVQEEISQIIFSQACKVLMDMISITRESTHILSTDVDSVSFGSENIPNTLFN
jgi:hypothetical protein